MKCWEKETVSLTTYNDVNALNVSFNVCLVWGEDGEDWKGRGSCEGWVGEECLEKSSLTIGKFRKGEIVVLFIGGFMCVYLAPVDLDQVDLLWYW